jgi:hypothetical protein
MEAAIEKHAHLHRLQASFDRHPDSVTRFHILRRVCCEPPTSLHYTATAMHLNLNTLRRNPNRYAVFALDTFDTYVPKEVIVKVIAMLGTCVHLTTGLGAEKVQLVREKAERVLSILLPLHVGCVRDVREFLAGIDAALAEEVTSLLEEMRDAHW